MTPSGGPQADIISCALEGYDSLVVMATGAGKSMCMQVPPQQRYLVLRARKRQQHQRHDGVSFDCVRKRVTPRTDNLD